MFLIVVGDEVYPNNIDVFNPLPIIRKQETMRSLRCKTMHRMEHSGVTTTLLDTRLSGLGASYS